MIGVRPNDGLLDRSALSASVTDPDEIVVYSDYVCPFCYLGRESLARYRQSRDDPLSVDWRPFDLRARERGSDGEIDPAADDGKDAAYYERARQNVRRLCEEYDVEMAQEIATDVDSLPAQAASRHVEREHPERWPDFDAAVFEALWVDGRDIGDADVLADIAADIGLDPAEIRDAATDEDVRADLRAAFREAQERGITGVPTFVYGDHAARGAVPPDHLQRLVEGT
ncbi:MAG: DsbA family protein [Haloferacaceae archaeon]